MVFLGFTVASSVVLLIGQRNLLANPAWLEQELLFHSSPNTSLWYEGKLDTPENTETCTAAAREGTDNAYSVTCTHGTGKYVQSVTRAFRLVVPDQALNSTEGNENRR